MSEPQCRACYLRSLPGHERERVAAEPVTAPVHYCAEHEVFNRHFDELFAHANSVLTRARYEDRAYEPLHVQIPRYSGKRRD